MSHHTKPEGLGSASRPLVLCQIAPNGDRATGDVSAWGGSTFVTVVSTNELANFCTEGMSSSLVEGGFLRQHQIIFHAMPSSTRIMPGVHTRTASSTHGNQMHVHTDVASSDDIDFCSYRQPQRISGVPFALRSRLGNRPEARNATLRRTFPQPRTL